MKLHPAATPGLTFVASVGAATATYLNAPIWIMVGSISAAAVVVIDLASKFRNDVRRTRNLPLYLTGLCAQALHPVAAGHRCRVTAFLPGTRMVQPSATVPKKRKEKVMVPTWRAWVADNPRVEQSESGCVFRRGDFLVGATWQDAEVNQVQIAGRNVRSMASFGNDEQEWKNYWRHQYQVPDSILGATGDFMRKVESIANIYLHIPSLDPLGRKKNFECILSIDWTRRDIITSIQQHYGRPDHLVALVNSAARAVLSFADPTD